jgi:hypothetical protein
MMKLGIERMYCNIIKAIYNRPIANIIVNLKLAKTLCFSFYLLWFFFHKIGKQDGKTGSEG